jgi:hypothetical protein
MYSQIKTLMIEAGIQVDPDTSTPLTFQERMEANHFLYFKGKTVEDFIGVVAAEKDSPAEDLDEGPDESALTTDLTQNGAQSDEQQAPPQEETPVPPQDEDPQVPTGEAPPDYAPVPDFNKEEGVE